MNQQESTDLTDLECNSCKPGLKYCSGILAVKGMKSHKLHCKGLSLLSTSSKSLSENSSDILKSKHYIHCLECIQKQLDR